MAEGQGLVVNDTKHALGAAEHDFVNDTFKVALVAAHTPNIDSMDTYAEIAADEVSGDGYTAGGATLSGGTWTQDNTNDRAAYDANNVTWTAANFGTPSHAYLYNDTHANKAVIGYWEVTTPSNGGNYTLNFNASGLFLVT